MIRADSSEGLLCRALADGSRARGAEAICALLRELGEDGVFEMAQVNQVASQIVHAQVDQEGADLVPQGWRDWHDAIDRRISGYLKELDRIAGRLAVGSVPVVALKNAGIARGMYGCPGCCPMGDLDVLVERRNFQCAHEILLAEGYRLRFRNALEDGDLEVAEAEGSAEYYRTLPCGDTLWLEVLWRPVDGRWIRPDQEPSAEELMARSVSIPGTHVRLLAPEDNLLHVALHTAKHSYVRAPGFRLHLDVDRIVNRQAINWDVFLDRVTSLRVRTPVYFSLAIPRALFSTPIPEAVLAALRPARWKERLISGWLQRVGLFNPDERKFSRPGYILFTALLYDDLWGLWRAIFPQARWMRQRYGFRSIGALPVYHARRLLDLALRRTL